MWRQKSSVTWMILLSLLAWGMFVQAAAGVEISVWYYPSSVDLPAWRTLFRDFEAAHPEIQLKLTQLPPSTSQYQKLLTAIAAGTGPDVVVYFDRFNIINWAARNAISPIDTYLQRAELHGTSFYPAAWQEVQYQGHTWAIPFETDVRVLFYNKTLFRRAGLDPDQPPHTWEELDRYAEQLTQVDDRGSYLQVGFIPWFAEGWFYTWAFTAGVDFYDPETERFTFADDPNAIKALDWITSYARRYDLNKLSRLTSMTILPGSDPAIRGRLAMLVAGNWVLRQFDRYAPQDVDFGVAPIPHPSWGETATWSGGHASFIPVGSRHPDEAWQLIHWISTGEANKRWNRETAHIPAIRELAQALYADDPQMRVFLDGLEYSRPRPPVPVGGLLWDELNRAVENAIHQRKFPEVALQQAQEKVQRQLDRILDRR
ncbi:MAG: ABC transporter substrate-binding protein [Candidatus Bipolaricaulia bacterium]